MPGGDYKPEWITKLDAARRQLSASIRLFFERRDPIAVHTLVFASHQVLTDLGKAAGVAGLLKGPGQPDKHFRAVNYAANFFKHGDRDGKGRINIEPLHEFNAEFLMNAVLLLERMTGNLPIEGKLYMAWFVTKNREHFDSSDDAIQQLLSMGIDPNDFPAVLNLLKLLDLTA